MQGFPLVFVANLEVIDITKIHPDSRGAATIDSCCPTDSVGYLSVCLRRKQHCVNNVDNTIISSNIWCCDCRIIHLDATIGSINFHI